MAQTSVTFDDVFRSRAFSAKGVYGLRSMEDGLHYSRQTSEGIEKFDFATGESQGVLVADGAAIDAAGAALPLGNYTWTAGEKKVIIEDDMQPIYRHSYTAKVYVYDLASGGTTLVSPEAIQNPVFNPDGDRIAWVHDNNVYYRSLAGSNPMRVTSDGVKNAVINGAPDWVYEEEFGFHVALSWSPNGRYLAYYRFDERGVTEFSMDMYGTDLYPEPYVFKYPKAGEANSLVTIWVYDTQTGKTVEATQGQTYEYVPRTHWSPKNELYLTLLNRHQDSLRLVSYVPSTGQAKQVFLETDPAYTDADHNLTFLKDGRFVWMSDRSGYNHVYLVDPSKNKLTALTSGAYEITELVRGGRSEWAHLLPSRGRVTREPNRLPRVFKGWESESAEQPIRMEWRHVQYDVCQLYPQPLRREYPSPYQLARFEGKGDSGAGGQCGTCKSHEGLCPFSEDFLHFGGDQRSTSSCMGNQAG